MKTSREDSSDKETRMKIYALNRSGTHDTIVSSAGAVMHHCVCVMRGHVCNVSLYIKLCPLFIENAVTYSATV
jgi:hypothetical protein